MLFRLNKPLFFMFWPEFSMKKGEYQKKNNW